MPEYNIVLFWIPAQLILLQTKCGKKDFDVLSIQKYLVMIDDA